MNLRIDSIYNHGDASNEYVALTVLSDTNLHYYIVTDTTYVANDQVSNVFRHTKWFPSVEVKKGDRVALWTGKGQNKTQFNNGVRWHYIYWQSDAPIWNDDGDAAILFEIAEWATKKAR